MSDKHSIVDILEHYGAKLPYKRNGWVKIKCCFHDDSHASAVFSAEENAFKCFACGIQGDTYDIISEQEGLSFVKAVEFAEGISSTGGTKLRSGRRTGGTVSRRKTPDVGRRGQVLDRGR